MTKRSSISVILTLLMTLVVYTTCQTVRQAVVKMQPTAASSYNVQGTLVLEEFENGENRISGVLSGMPEGSYGFHIHMFGDISSDQGTATGSHFNPNNAPHSNNLSDMNRHVGDMGNIAFNSSQIAVVDLTDQLWTLHGNQSVVGRSVIIHSIEDTGGSSYGARYAQGVIGIKFVSSGTNAAMNDEPGSSSTFAVCELTGAFTGRVVFSEDTGDNTMAITAKICGLSDGYHGIHVHTYGDLSGGFDLAGGHYNPTSVAHGLPSDSVKHFGDIGNIYSFNGTADFSGEFTQLTTMGSNSLFGRSIVIHQDKDWGKEYQSAGNSGTRVAMCVIGVQNSLKSVDDITCEPLEYVEMAVVQLVKTTQTNNNIQGTLHFSKGSDGQYRVNGTITGLAANSVHGLHIHQYGDLSSADGSATGGHYNPYNAPHSNDLSDMNRHLGDMGNITSDDNGVAHVDIDQVLWTLNGPDSIVGRAVILHEKVDDGNATANGNAGKRYAQGVIGVKNVPMNLARGNQVNKMYAAAEIVGTSIRGRITFSQATESSRVTVNIKVCGLGVGPHGIHVHEFGDVSAGIDSVGGHYNPEGNPHRYPDNPDRHVGDMGNITATAYGAEATFTIDKLTLYGEHSILGRAVIVHSGADQGVSQQPAGASGTKVAVGIIGTTASEVSLASIECEDPVFSSSPVADSSDDSASMPSARVSLLALVLMAFATLLAISL